MSNSCGAPWRRRRAQSCLRGWRIRCCRFHACSQDAAGAIAGPSRRASAGPYRLPHDVRDRLAAALAPFRNRDAAFALATFLGRFWSTPARLLAAFPIDRRELAEHAALGLTEARVRGAIRALEEVGFLDRAVASGSTHRPTPDGLHRKPVLFMFGSDYGPLFSAANRRAAAARERRSGARRGPAAGRGPAAVCGAPSGSAH